MAHNPIHQAARRVLWPIHRSLRYKLMLLMVVIAVLPLAMVTLFVTKTTSHSLSQEVVRSNEARMEWVAHYFDEKFEQLNAVTYSLLLDKKLFPDLTRSRDDAPGDARSLDVYTTEKMLLLYNANNKNIARITLYLKSRDRLYTVDKDASGFTDDWGSSPFDWHALADTRQTVARLLAGNSNTLTIVHSMNRFENRELLGGVTIDARWSMMRSVLNMVHSEPDSEVFVVDGEGREMYNPYSMAMSVDGVTVSQAVADPAKPGVMVLKKGFLFYEPILSGQLWIVKFIPIDYVTRVASSTLHFSIVTAIATILVAIVVSVLTAYFLTKPIIRLTKSMKAVEIQNFDVGLREPKSDEIGTLERRFNSMLRRIRELIQIEYKAKIEMRTAQVKALQAQINPHFLHNALQSIGGLALSRNVPEINEHVRAISDLFRYTIRMKSDLVTVADELEHVGNYLNIQQLRFVDMMAIRIEADDDCLLCPIPKFSLQPIVENCFVHGLEGKMGQWSVSIHVERLLGEVEITLADNGVGIDEVRLEEIRMRLEGGEDEPEKGGSIGLHNVQARIRLLLGEEYGLFVSSVRGEGTTVRLVLPAEPKAKEERE